MIYKIILNLIGLIIVTNAIKSYENYKIYNVVPNSEEHVQILTDLKKEFDFWTDIFTVGDNVRILVPPNEDNTFKTYAESVGLSADVSVSNVQTLIDAQLRPADSTLRNSLGSFSWENYHTLAEIHAWLDELQELYPDIVTTLTIGRSNEDRPIKGVIIDFKPGQRGDKPLAGMIEGGIHSREWISPATVTWIIKEFLTSNDPQVRSMAESLVWHIFPVINPDGYFYTFDNDRMWRKNRNPINATACASGNHDLSNGIDLNRNFDFLWMSVGASNHSCDQTFAGPSGGSEAETRAISNYVLQLNEDAELIYYFAFHSYSQMILVPYSHASGRDVLEVGNYPDLYEIAIRGAEKLTEKHGTPYLVGTSAEILYEVSGSSFDWVKGVVKVPIVYLFELRDTGTYGFLLPPEQIVPNNEEIMACLVEMDIATKELGYYRGVASSVASSLMSLAISIVFLIIFK